jgi:hypothetical protein
MKIPAHLQPIVDLCCQAIKEHRFISFYFENEKGEEAYRTIAPYMVAMYKEDLKNKKAGKFYVAGRDTRIDEPRQFYLEKINIRIFQLEEKIFVDPGVDPNIVIYTKDLEVYCRFIYPFENKKAP